MWQPLLPHRACAAADQPGQRGIHPEPYLVYYCHDEGGILVKCIAEVTNTPWGHASASYSALG